MIDNNPKKERVIMKEATTKFEKWLEEVNEELKERYNKRYPSDHMEYDEMTYSKGRKYIKIKRDGSVWAFVAMKDVPNKGYKEGDLLKPAGSSTPAKHARGNIFEGTARYGLYGPEYLK